MAWTRTGSIPDELEEALALERRARLPLHDPDLPEPERPHDPDGAPPPRDRRARRRPTDLLVLEDDPYGLIRFEGKRRRRSSSLARDRRSYTSSFSKTIAPGLRVGWYVFPEELAAAARRAGQLDLHHARCCSSEATVYEFIRRGNFEPNLERVNGLLKARRDAMLAALDRAPRRRGLVASREGGYFIWLELPDGDERPSCARRAEGVTAVLGTDFGGADEYAAPGLQLRLARRDRARRRAARRGGLTRRASAAGSAGASHGGRATQPWLARRLEHAARRPECRAGPLERQARRGRGGGSSSRGSVGPFTVG